MRKYSALLLLIIYTSFVSALDTTAILNSINNARTSPSTYADFIQNNYFTFERFKWKVNGKTWLTSDGVYGVLDAINYLKAMTPVGALTMETGLDVSAQVQANFLLNQNSLPKDPYLGCRNQNVGERVSYVGTWTKVSETMIGEITDPDEIVIRWIVADGDTTKQTRTNILDPNMNQIGFGMNNVTGMDNLLIVHMAKDFACDIICPKVPDQKPFNCDGYGFEYAFTGNLSLNMLIIIFANILIWSLL